MGERDETRDLGPKAKDVTAAPPLDETAEAPRSEAADAAPPVPESLDQSIWPVIEGSRYRIAGEHARGGLGRILEAIDCRLDRRVAVKQLLSRGHRNEARFVREALVTARLQHPSIVSVHEVGRWPTGEPFYTMKMVSGRSLGEVIDEKASLADRLALLPNVIAVADAIAYAHSQRVLHRDLKPSNVLIGPFGETVVIDWGLAADLSRPGHPAETATSPYRVATAGLTVAGTILGTPEYMPPEQARGEGVDERADVYSIGAILYHLLAGRAPYPGKTSDEVLTQLNAGPPPPLEVQVPPDLVAIMSKAMARDASDRYRSAQELVDDLRRFQTGQLVAAHQYSTRLLLWRWMQRHSAAISVAAFAVALMATLGAVSVRRIVRERNVARQERTVAQKERVQAETSRNQYIIQQARTLLDKDPTAAIAVLKTYPATGGDLGSVLEVGLEAQARGVAKDVFQVTPIPWAFSPDSQFLATSLPDGRLGVQNVWSGETIRAFPFKRRDVSSVRFARDGRQLLFVDRGQRILVWNIASDDFRELSAGDPDIVSAAFSRDGKLVAAVGLEIVRLWNLATGSSEVLGRPKGRVVHAEFSPTSPTLVTAGEDGLIRVWNIATGAHLSHRYGQYRYYDVRISFSPGGNLFAAVGTDGTVLLWSPTSGASRLLRSNTRAWSLSFSPDGQCLAAGYADGTIRIWDMNTGRIRLLRGHGSVINDVLWSPNGRTLASASGDSTVRLWDTNHGAVLRILHGHKSGVSRLVFSADGHQLASLALDKTIRTWLIPSTVGRVLMGHEDRVFHVVLSPDGKLAATASRDKTVRVWNIASGESITLRGHQDFVYKVAFSPDSKMLASASMDATIRVCELSTLHCKVLRGHERGVVDVAFSPDGTLLASGSGDGGVGFWNMEASTSVIRPGHTSDIRSISFSEDGGLLATAGSDNTIRLWDTHRFESRTLEGHTESVNSVAFSPTRRSLASASSDHTVRVWDLASGSSRVLVGHDGAVLKVGFSPDGELVASASEDKTIRLWNLQERSARVLRGHSGSVRDVVFSSDGDILASGSADDTVRIWYRPYDLNRLIHSENHYLGSLAIARNSSLLAFATAENGVQLWSLESRASLPRNHAESLDWLRSLTTAILSQDGGVVTPPPGRLQRR